MSEPTFPILGAEVPPLLGRTRIMQRIWNDLTKATPSNLSIVGPRFMGKTVIMNDLARRMLGDGSPYSFVLHWHLGHVSPSSDEEFVAQLCQRLRDCLAQSQAGTDEYRTHLQDESFSNLSEVADLLGEEGRPILMLWDGFDKPLGQGRLTGHFWDQMRTLFYGKKHKVVTATRRPLSELLRTQDAITSPFWNIFDIAPVRVGAFDEQDRDEIVAVLSAHSLQAGAKTELANWSAGIPILLLELLNQVAEAIPRGSVSNEAINEAARTALGKLTDVVAAMWDDCPAGAKDIYVHLVDRGNMAVADAQKDQRACLIEKGFVQQSGNRLVASCRMLQEHIRGANNDAGTMARLFDTWDDYRSNIRTFLERRLGHISHFDERLHRLVARAIEDIPDHPDDCLNTLTGIRDAALELIWQRECGESMAVPADVIAYWTTSPRDTNRLVESMMNEDCWKVPSDPLAQIRLLGLFTGSVRHFDVKAKVTSKDTYVLIDAIHNFRNRAEHSAGQPIHLGVAVAAIMTCLELLGCLERKSP